MWKIIGVCIAVTLWVLLTPLQGHAYQVGSYVSETGYGVGQYVQDTSMSGGTAAIFDRVWGEWAIPTHTLANPGQTQYCQGCGAPFVWTWVGLCSNSCPYSGPHGENQIIQAGTSAQEVYGGAPTSGLWEEVCSGGITTVAPGGPISSTDIISVTIQYPVVFWGATYAYVTWKDTAPPGWSLTRSYTVPSWCQTNQGQEVLYIDETQNWYPSFGTVWGYHDTLSSGINTGACYRVSLGKDTCVDLYSLPASYLDNYDPSGTWMGTTVDALCSGTPPDCKAWEDSSTPNATQ